LFQASIRVEGGCSLSEHLLNLGTLTARSALVRLIQRTGHRHATHQLPVSPAAPIHDLSVFAMAGELP